MKRVKQVQSATISAVITRADGTIEDLGQICTYTRPRWRTLLLDKLKGLRWRG